MRKSLRSCVIGFCVFCVLIMTVCFSSHPSSVCENIAFLSVWKSEAPITINSGETEISRYSVEMPPFEIKQNMVLVMKFKARLHTEAPAGWNEFLGIEVNGHLLDKYTSFSGRLSGYNRLINRVSPLATTLGEKEWWARRNNIPVLLVYFGDGKNLDERIQNYKEEGYCYVLNISDVAHYVEVGADDRIEKAESNRITFINTYLNKYVPGKVIDMVIEDLEIGYLPVELVAKHSKPKIIDYTPVKLGQSLRGGEYVLNVGEFGDLEVLVGEAKYKLVSSYSYPGEKIGYYYFDANKESDGIWGVDIRVVDNASVEIKGGGKYYEVIRNVSVTANKILIKETISNNTDEPIGILFAHQIILEDLPQQFRLAGVDSTDMLAGVAENPTIFINYKESSLGFLAEDNLMRAQGEVARRNNMFQFSVKHFGLDKGKSYTFQYALYPMVGGDYFKFINRVRNEWKVNYTIEGPFAFTESVVSSRRVKIYCAGPWLDYYSINPDTGKVYTREEYKKYMKSVVEKIKQVQSDAYILGLLETNLVSIDKREIEGGDVLPGGSSPRSGIYGAILDKKQSEVLKAGINGWIDSILQTDDGRVIVDTYYPTLPYMLNLMVYLEKGNYRYNFFKSQIDFLIDEVGLDGIYIDQFTLNWGPIGRVDRHTYEKWDGYTVDIDEKTGKIIRKYTDCGVIGAEARGDILKYIISKGGICVVNSFPSAKEEQSIPNVFRFAEFENDPVNPLTYMNDKPPLTIYCAKGHLSTPIILGIRPERFGEKGNKRYAEIIMKSVITALRNGLLYYYYGKDIPSEGEGSGEYGPINHMFPFTPVEINEGYLIGRERMITTVSGTFKWHKDPQIYLFNLKGKPISHNFTISKTDDGYTIEINLVDWNQICIIE